MTEIAATETVAPANADRFTPEYCAANRVVSSDNAIQDGTGTELEWFVLIDRTIGAEGKGCACGCGFKVTNTKREFLPGHDQRLMGILARAQREDLEVCWMSGGLLIGGTATDYGRLVLNEKGQAKLDAYLANTPKRVRKNGRRIGEATPAAEAPAPKADPLPTTVKVGRWEYPVVDVERDGNGTVVAVTYKNKQGAEMVTRTWGSLV